MEIKTLPKLKLEQIGVWNIAGWYFTKHELYPSKETIAFQCLYGHGGMLPAECAVDRDGTVRPGIKCWCGKFTHAAVLQEWTEHFFKLEGQETVTKAFQLTKQ